MRSTLIYFILDSSSYLCYNIFMPKTLNTSNEFICQGRPVNTALLTWLQSLIDTHPDWSRFRIAIELCKLWNWSTPTGQLKDFAARTFLRKLYERGLITLPPTRPTRNKRGFATAVRTIPQHLHPQATVIEISLAHLLPLSFMVVSGSSDLEHRFHHYLVQHHYLGFNRTVGENLKYLIQDRHGRDLACVLFGAAAWKTQPRDQFIGWNRAACQKHLSCITNNTRFLILPWVRVPHLASHILGRISRRISSDWQTKYAHPVHLLETFVEKDRFLGTCYKAANWICVGSTKGRSRQDRYNTLQVPIKAIYLYPLIPNFRELLSNENS